MAVCAPHLHCTEGLSKRAVPIGVFWDIENCSVPRGRSALSLVQRVRDLFFTGHREVEFMCVCDTSKESKDIIQELNYAQVTVVHIHATSKNAADDKLRQSLRRFANAHPSPATAVLLSGDVNFASELSDLRYRHHHHVILVHPVHCQVALLNCAHECHLYEDIIADLPLRGASQTADGSATELSVTGLPRNRPPRVIQQRLRQLSDNCGGRVVSVSKSSALLRFSSVDTTLRAKKRLEGEDVFGTKIRVHHSSGSEPLSVEIDSPPINSPVHTNNHTMPAHAANTPYTYEVYEHVEAHNVPSSQHLDVLALPSPGMHSPRICQGNHRNLCPQTQSLERNDSSLAMRHQSQLADRAHSLSPKYFRARSWSRTRTYSNQDGSPEHNFHVSHSRSPAEVLQGTQAARYRQSKSCETRSSQNSAVNHQVTSGTTGNLTSAGQQTQQGPLDDDCDTVPQRDCGVDGTFTGHNRITSSAVNVQATDASTCTEGSLKTSSKAKKKKQKAVVQKNAAGGVLSNMVPKFNNPSPVNQDVMQSLPAVQVDSTQAKRGIAAQKHIGEEPVAETSSQDTGSPKRTAGKKRRRKKSNSEKQAKCSGTAQKLKSNHVNDPEENSTSDISTILCGSKVDNASEQTDSHAGKTQNEGIKSPQEISKSSTSTNTSNISGNDHLAFEDQAIICLKRYDGPAGHQENISNDCDRDQQSSPDVIVEAMEEIEATVRPRSKSAPIPINVDAMCPNFGTGPATGTRRRSPVKKLEKDGKVRNICFTPSSSKKTGDKNLAQKQISPRKVSPHKVHKPRPMRPKYQSPGKYQNGQDGYQNQYATVPYQYGTPPAVHKFNHYRYTTWGDYGGYYSQFGYSQQHQQHQQHGDAAAAAEGSEIREVVDKFSRNRKLSREFLFMQQQIYEEDKWDKDGGGGGSPGDGDLDDDILLDDVDVFCREECHSAPPLPFPHSLQLPNDRVRHNSMSPGWARHSPAFRRTPGASRPNSRQSNYSGGGGVNSRPGSSMSMRSNSSYGSNHNYHSEGNEFFPVLRRTSPLLSISDLGEDATSEAADVESDMGNVELMVSNLDYNISAREWKKILYAEFHQHVQVIDVYIQTQPDNTNIGYIKVPDIDDARFAISQFHRKKIGYKRIHVTLVNQDEAAAANTKNDVVAILQEVPSHQLSLYKLMELYEKRFKTPVTVSEIYGFQDVLKIWELEGQGRVVKLLPSAIDPQGGEHAEEISKDTYSSPLCPIHCPEGSSAFQEAMETSIVVFVTLQLKGFSAQVHTLIQSHEDCLPLASFPTCYSCEFGHLQTVSHGGIPLEHLISCVPGVKIAVTPSGVKNIQWAENKPSTAIENGRFCPSPLLNQQLLQFSREVVELLKHSPQCRLPFNKFIPTYHHHLGRQCRVADYGYTKLMELFDAIPHVVQVIGVGNRKYVTLTHRAQTKRFAMDILRVLKSQASKQISVLDLPVVYNKVFAKPFDVTEYGLSYLEDILAELPENTINVSGSANEMVIFIPRRDQTSEEVDMTKQFALEVIDLLKHTPQCRMAFHRFIPAYHHHFGKQCRVSDYGFTKLVELFEAIPHVLKVVEEEEDKVLTLVEPELLLVLEERVAALLRACPNHRLPAPEFLSSYTRHHGHSLRLQDYGAASVMELVNKIQCIAQVELREGKYVIRLVDRSLTALLGQRVLLLLMEQVGGSMELGELQARYRQLFGYTFTEAEVRRDLSELVQVTTTSDKVSVKLCSLQMFARDVRSLLRHHNGKLTLGQFETAYARHFGVHLVPASYGYPSATALLQAITHVAQLRGKGPNRTVLLCQDFQGKLMTAGPNRMQRATSPLVTDGEITRNTELGADLMSHKILRRSPCDLLSATVPSGVPSPELSPSVAAPPSDLMKFDSMPACVQDFFDSMSPKEKKGQRTPLCKTPVSEMLQFAAQLLPTGHSQPQSPMPESVHYAHPYSQYPHNTYLTEVPPVPLDAPHVAMLEQQLGPHSHPDANAEFRAKSPLSFQYPYSEGLSDFNRPTVFDDSSTTGFRQSYQLLNDPQPPGYGREFVQSEAEVNTQEAQRLLSMLQGAQSTENQPGLYAAESSISPDKRENAVATGVGQLPEPVKYGGTMFWLKTDSMADGAAGSIPTEELEAARVAALHYEPPHPDYPSDATEASRVSPTTVEQAFMAPEGSVSLPEEARGSTAIVSDTAKQPPISPPAVAQLSKLTGRVSASQAQRPVPPHQLVTPAALAQPGKLAYSMVVAQGTSQKPSPRVEPSGLEKDVETIPAEASTEPESDNLSPSTSPMKTKEKDDVQKEVIQRNPSSPPTGRCRAVSLSDLPPRRPVSTSSLADGDTTDTSVTSSLSPSRRQGTPRKSRLAARFRSSPISQSQ